MKILKLNQSEVAGGIEPPSKVLQTRAWPLGHTTIDSTILNRNY